MIRRQLINFGSRSTDFRVGEGVVEQLGKMVKCLVATPKRAVIVTESSLAESYGLEVSRALIDAGFTVCDLSLPTGENVATMAYAVQLFDALDSCGITRDDVIVALGGMGVCSLVSFCAHAWCGETPFALVPTTLDAMTSCATSMRPLDTRSSSQMISVEPRAALVACDLDLVPLCPHDERMNGYVMLCASAFIDSRRQWDRFGELVEGVLDNTEVPMVDVLCMAQTARSSVIKAANPSARNALEFGVTTARALRSCLGDAIPAYQLLAEGMRFEARLAVDAFGFDIDDVFSLDDRLDDLGVEELPFELEFDRFLTALKETRFKRSNRFMFSLPRHVGTVRYATVEDDVLERHARAYLASRAELMDESV